MLLKAKDMELEEKEVLIKEKQDQLTNMVQRSNGNNSTDNSNTWNEDTENKQDNKIDLTPPCDCIAKGFPTCFIYKKNHCGCIKGTNLVHPNVSIIWIGSLGEESVPPMQINFIDKSTLHNVNLERRSPFGKISSTTEICSFQGGVEGHEKSSVTVSGCPYEDFQVIIHVKGQKPIIATVSNGTILSNGAGYGKRELPKKLYIRLAIINQIMLHTEGLFHDESLGADITFQEMTLYDHSEVSSVGAAHFVLFSYDASGDEVVGMSYIGKICSEDASSRISIAEYDQSPVHTAMIFAHELGHNLGLAHDAGICVGIMYPLIIGADAWSNCSKLQLKGYYNKVLNKIPFFCLEEGSGTWSDWSKWSGCGEDCKRSRKRKCDKNICDGIMTEKQSCHPCGEIAELEEYISPTKKSINIRKTSTEKPDYRPVSEVKNMRESDVDRLIDHLFGRNISPTMRRILRAKFKLVNGLLR
ncbi:ADAM9 [Lepeophtheirus salmonis]|uniref:ADAM9 n=1 Tax=Lepeophtheirus salmonis TaxID=72036 RepID=A0A7R8CR28_LEPSM|nr:ADAM9 [Lepeophtheirus salmonis]CAF2864491.1 ADAM9 [Lepeophtheirus salmonis]